MKRLGGLLFLGALGCSAIDQLKTGVRQGVHDVKREVKETGAGAALAGCGPKLREPYEMDAQQEYVVGRTAAARQLAQLDGPALPMNR